MKEIEKIKEVIENIRPYLQNDGGEIEFVKFEEDIVYVKVSGACSGCGMLEVTLKDLVETAIIQEVPNVKAVINIK